MLSVQAGLEAGAMLPSGAPMLENAAAQLLLCQGVSSKL